MKKNYFTLLLFIHFSIIAFAQKTGYGVYPYPQSTKACITEELRAKMKTQINENKKQIKFFQSNAQLEKESNVGGFIWPMGNNSPNEYAYVWGISNFVDHNQSFPDELTDWGCGERTYDLSSGYNHKGTDIFSWPFSFYMMENNIATAIAAQEGTITYKEDGNYDRNCDFSNPDWNVVVIEHSDGTYAYYGHLKSGSITTKNVGETVSQGEYLGVIGSSGNSTGPHLHFEVYDANDSLLDPFQGNCNYLNDSSLWENQIPYNNPKINAVSTHFDTPAFLSCPNTSIPNYENNFAGGDDVYAFVFLTDQMPNTSGVINLYRPNSSLAVSYTRNFSTFKAASYFWWNFAPETFDQNGEWTVSFTYNNTTVDHKFNYGVNLGEEDIAAKNAEFIISQNPAKNAINITSTKEIEKYSLYNINGSLVKTADYKNQPISIANLAQGAYIVTVSFKDGSLKSQKLIKE